MSPEEEIYKEIGSELQKIRKKVGLSQEELAKKIGITRSIIGKAESQGGKLSVFRIKQILDALGYEWKFSKKKKTHVINIPDEEYRTIQTLIEEPETDPQGDELRTRLKRFLFPS